MQRPPAISMHVVRSRRAGCIFAMTATIFGLIPLYSWYHGLPVDRLGLLTCVWALSSLALGRYWFQSPQGRLSWDGEVWHWSGLPAPLKQVRIQYDFQRSIWISLQPARGKELGLWVEADPTRLHQWQALRRALVGAGISLASGVAPMDDSILHAR